MLLWIFAYKFFCGYMVSILLGIHFRGRIGRSCAHCMFNILRNCQTVFLSGCTILHSYQQCMMVPNSLHLCQHLLLYVSLVIPTHSSTLAWKIPWMEEPGRLQSMGSHRVRHDWSDLAAAAVDVGASQVVLVVKNPPANARDTRKTGSIPWSERSPGGGNGYSLQYSCLENPMDRGAWQATVHGVTKSQTQLSD